MTGSARTVEITVSGGAWHTVRGVVGTPDFAAAVAALPAELDYLVQDFVPEVVSDGEWSLLFFDGQCVDRVVGARPFEVWDGTRLVPIPEYLRRTPRPDLLRFDERMRELATGPTGNRAGDVLLLARSGSAEPIEQRFYFGAENYTSWHGSPSAQDSRIPMVVAHPARSGAELRAMLRPVLGPTPSQVEFARLIHTLFRQE